MNKSPDEEPLIINLKNESLLPGVSGGEPIVFQDVIDGDVRKTLEAWRRECFAREPQMEVPTMSIEHKGKQYALAYSFAKVTEEEIEAKGLEATKDFGLADYAMLVSILVEEDGSSSTGLAFVDERLPDSPGPLIAAITRLAELIMERYPGTAGAFRADVARIALTGDFKETDSDEHVSRR